MFEIYTRMLFHHETDADGVCHFSNYFRICEEAFFHVIASQQCTSQVFAIRDATAQYMKPLRFPNRFAVEIDLVEMKRSNFLLGFTIQTQNESNARIQLRFVPMCQENWTPIPLPENIKLYLKEKVKPYDANNNAILFR